MNQSNDYDMNYLIELEKTDEAVISKADLKSNMNPKSMGIRN